MKSYTLLICVCLIFTLLFQGYIMAAPFSFEFPDAVNEMVLKSPCYIKASDGVDLAYYGFVPFQPNAIIIFYHGSGAWSNKLYSYMAQQLCDGHDIGTYLFDIRGHGNSRGPRGDAPSKEQIWQDISTAINFVSQKYPGCPIFLGGHSSGAGLILNYSSWNKHEVVAGYLLLAPFLGVQSNTAYEHSDPEKRFVKNVRLFPLIVNALTNGFLFAHTPVIFYNYPIEEKNKDGYLLDYHTNTMAQALSPYDAKKLFVQLDKPCCLLTGACDELFIPEKIICFGKYAQQVADQSVNKIIPQAKHLSIVIESAGEIAQWIENCVTS